MKYADKYMTGIPLKEIWDDDQKFESKRGEYLNKENVKAIISLKPIEFVVADIGLKPSWIKADACYHFWKSEVEVNLAENFNEIDLGKSALDYLYLASIWNIENQRDIILLEKIH